MTHKLDRKHKERQNFFSKEYIDCANVHKSVLNNVHTRTTEAATRGVL